MNRIPAPYTLTTADAERMEAVLSHVLVAQTHFHKLPGELRDVLTHSTRGENIGDLLSKLENACDTVMMTQLALVNLARSQPAVA